MSEFSCLQQEHSVRNLLKRLEKNEMAYQESKEDFDIGDSMRSYLDGRIRESEIIRIELEKILSEAKTE